MTDLELSGLLGKLSVSKQLGPSVSLQIEEKELKLTIQTEG